MCIEIQELTGKRFFSFIIALKNTSTCWSDTKFFLSVSDPKIISDNKSSEYVTKLFFRYVQGKK